MKRLLFSLLCIFACSLVFAQENSTWNSSDASYKVITTLNQQPLLILQSADTHSEITNVELEQIDSRRIKEIRVLDSGESFKLYGDKGKNGVMVITLKGNLFSENYSRRKE